MSVRRSDNLRAAPPWITPDMVGRILALAMPVDQDTVPVVQVPTRGVKPRLEIVSEQPNPPLASTHLRRTEESEAASYGPTRAASPLRRKAPTAPNWTPEEDERLRLAYENGERIDHLAEELGRPYKGTISRASKLGFAHPRDIKGGFITKPKWSEAEDQLLRDLYGEAPTKELPERIVGRSLRSIYQRAFELDLKHGYSRQWTRNQLRALQIAHARGIAVADVAAALGRRSDAVSKYAANHRLAFGRRPLLASPITVERILELEDPAVHLPPLRDRADEVREERNSRRDARREEIERRRRDREEAVARARAERAVERAATAAKKAKRVCEVEKPAPRQVAEIAPSREPAVHAVPQPRAQPIVVRQTPGAPRYVNYAERMNAAVAYLRQRGFVVQRHSRDEIIARWRVSGWTGLFSNEQLIELAEHHGLELRA